MKKRALLIVCIVVFLMGCHSIFKDKRPAVPSMTSYWVFPEKRPKSKEIKIQDWIQCGGLRDGWYHTPLPPNQLLATEQVLLASRQKVEEIERCMLNKGYRYHGSCENRVIKTSVVCLE